jgi:hypothetical protein
LPVRAGCRTLADARARQDLTDQQRIGLTHFEDFQLRIPRAEVAECEVLVRRAFLKVGGRRGGGWVGG